MFGNPILYGAMRLSELALSFILGSKGLEILKRDTNLNTLCLFQFHFQSLFKNISQYQMLSVVTCMRGSTPDILFAQLILFGIVEKNLKLEEKLLPRLQMHEVCDFFCMLQKRSC
jgi:hypothetical protein